MNNYTLLTRIGQGMSSKVYKAQNTTTNQIVALKIIKCKNDVSLLALSEISILHQLQHINIISIHDTLNDCQKIILCLEYCDLNLREYIDKYYPNIPTRNFLSQICQAIAFCHKNNIMHRDVKPENILIVTSTNTIKLADFGFAKRLSYSTPNYIHNVVSLWYRAPELLLREKYSLPIDIWSLGCVFSEIHTGISLYSGKNDHHQLYMINSIKTPHIAQLARHLLKQMIKYDQQDRITADQILQHSFFSDS